MGSNGPVHKSFRQKDGSLHVLVTGFGPFGRHKENPSWLIARSLPDSIPGVKKGTKIHIHVQPEPVRVSYKSVRELIPPLLFSESQDSSGFLPNFDFVLHIGVSHAQDYYEMETQAFRDDYFLHDVDGKTKPEGFALWKDQGAPEMIKIGFDAALVHESWKRGVPDTDVRVSTDAGRFLCEYILFTSLFEYYRHSETQGAPVTFLHVPTGREDADIDQGKKVAIAMIQALAQNQPSL